MARFESVPDFYQIRTGPKNNFFALFHFEPIYEADRYGNYSLSYYSRGFIQNLSTDKDEAYTKAVELVGDAKAIRWESDSLETVEFGRKLPRTPEEMEAVRKAEAEKEAKRQAENKKWEAVYERVASERKHTATYVRRYLKLFIKRLGPWKWNETTGERELLLGYDKDGGHFPGRNWVERIIVDLYHGKVPRGRAIDILSDCYAKGYGRTNSKAYKAGYAEADKMWDSLFKWQSKNNY